MNPQFIPFSVALWALLSFQAHFRIWDHPEFLFFLPELFKSVLFLSGFCDRMKALNYQFIFYSINYIVY